MRISAIVAAAWGVCARLGWCGEALIGRFGSTDLHSSRASVFPSEAKSSGIRIRIAVLVSGFAGVAAAGLAAPSTAAAASCPYSPNFYAGGTMTNTNGSHYGARGYIWSTTLTVPHQNHDFTAQHFTAISTSAGIEVGWYIGWGNETGSYVTSPHAYATLNGPHEQDGPAVGNADDFYSTYWSGSTQIWNVRKSAGGTLIWGSSQAASDSGPGTIVALGEVNQSGLNMSGTFDGAAPELEFFSGTGAWDPWQGVSVCADSGYGASGSVFEISDGN